MSLTVLQVNTLGKTLSTGRTTRELHDYLIANNHKSFIACPYKKDCDDAYNFSSLNFVHLDVAISLVTGFEGSHSSIPTLRLIRYIKKIKPDIIHLRVLHCHCLNFKMLCKYLKKTDIPTVITLHDLWYITGLCPFYSAINCNKWIQGCGNCPNLLFGKRKPLFDRTKSMWNYKKECFTSIPHLAIVGVSQWATNEAKKSFLKNSSIITTIYNWIDLEKFYPKDNFQIPQSNGKKVILSVATCWYPHNRKGFDAILGLSEILPNDYIIVLIGDVKCEKSLPENIVCAGKISDVNLLADYYSASSVYLNLSEAESFGKVSAEALSCGTPLVSFNSTANAELVPKNGGTVIESREPEVILEAIQKVCSKSKEFYTPICREFAINNFDKISNIEKYIRLYNELIESKSLNFG